MRRAFSLILFLIASFVPISSAFGQSMATNDSQTLQALLREVKALRQDVRTITVASERARILLVRLQSEQLAVNRAQKDVDSTKTQLDQAQKRVKNLQQNIDSETNRDNEDATPNAAERQRIERLLKYLKSNLDTAFADEQTAESNDMDAKQRLQTEQSKLDTLQDELDQVDKSLADLGNQPVN